MGAGHRRLGRRWLHPCRQSQILLFDRDAVLALGGFGIRYLRAGEEERIKEGIASGCRDESRRAERILEETKEEYDRAVREIADLILGLEELIDKQ